MHQGIYPVEGMALTTYRAFLPGRITREQIYLSEAALYTGVFTYFFLVFVVYTHLYTTLERCIRYLNTEPHTKAIHVTYERIPRTAERKLLKP